MAEISVTGIQCTRLQAGGALIGAGAALAVGIPCALGAIGGVAIACALSREGLKFKEYVKVPTQPTEEIATEPSTNSQKTANTKKGPASADESARKAASADESTHKAASSDPVAADNSSDRRRFQVKAQSKKAKAAAAWNASRCPNTPTVLTDNDNKADNDNKEQKGPPSPCERVSLRGKSGQEIQKLFRDEGYQTVRGGGRGSHIKLTKPGQPTVTIPQGDRRGLAPGTVHALEKMLENGSK